MISYFNVENCNIYLIKIVNLYFIYISIFIKGGKYLEEMKLLDKQY
jgi:hypothetical protein